MNGNKVPETEGAKYAMDLPDHLPDDLDYGAYVEKATSMLYEIGYYEKPKTLNLF
jgi:hypothetical protein